MRDISQIKPIAPTSNKGVSKVVVQFTLDGQPIAVHKNASQAAQALGKLPATSHQISQVCKGLKNQAFGYQWKYEEDLND